VFGGRTVREVENPVLAEAEPCVEGIPLDPGFQVVRIQFVGDRGKHFRAPVESKEVRQLPFTHPPTQQRGAELVELKKNDLSERHARLLLAEGLYN
jgi:hypothetical protein